MADLLQELLDNPNIENIAVPMRDATYRKLRRNHNHPTLSGDVAAQLAQMVDGAGLADD